MGPLFDGGLQCSNGDLLAADHSDVAGHSGELGQGDVLGIGPLGGAQSVKGQLRAVELRVHTVVLGHQGMDLAEYAHLAAVHQDPGAAAGVIGGIVQDCFIGGVRDADGVQNGLDRAFQDEEVHSVAIAAHREHLGLVRHAVLPLKIGAAQFVQAGGLVAEVIVPGQDLQHGGQDGGAHDGGVLAQGIHDLHRVPAGIVLGPADLVVVGGGDEGVGDDLIIAQGAAGLAQGALHLLNRGVAAPGGLPPHEGSGDVVIAVEPGDLLGQVGDALHVAAPGGDDDIGRAVGEALIPGDDAHPLQIPVLVHGRDVSAQQGVDPVGIHPDGAGLGDIVQNVDDAVHDLACAQQLHQLTGPVHSGQGVQGIQTLFKLGAGLGAHTKGQGALADAGAVKVGRLKDYVHGVSHDLTVLAAHDTRQAHSPGVVGDDQVVGGELPDLAVQGGQLLALLSQADYDLTALHIAVVEGVHGLAILQHNVVGNVHNVVDGTHTHGTQPLPHPLGGGGDLHVADHPGGVAGA